MLSLLLATINDKILAQALPPALLLPKIGRDRYIGAEMMIDIDPFLTIA